MKYCPVCKQEYADKMKACKDCGGVGLVDKVLGAATAKYDKPDAEIDYDEMEEVFAGDYFKAELLKGELETEGITAVIDGDELVHTVGLPVGDATIDNVRLLVHSVDFDKAMEIITESDSITDEELERAASEYDDEETEPGPRELKEEEAWYEEDDE